MNFQFQVSSSGGSSSTVTANDAPTVSDPVDLLRQLVQTQREQLHLMKQQSAAHDSAGRWRSFLNRWKDDYADLPEACRKAMPILEKAYINLIADLAQYLEEQGEECARNEFSLSEFLDRYGMRLNQLAVLLSLVGPLADIAGASEDQSKR